MSKKEYDEPRYQELINQIGEMLQEEETGAVCQPEELQNWKDFYQVFIKDMRGQIFYE